MTSPNLIEYKIKKDNILIGHHQENIKNKFSFEKLLKYQPLSDYTIASYGYDEGGEKWEGPTVNLKDFLEKIKIVHKDIENHFELLDSLKRDKKF